MVLLQGMPYNILDEPSPLGLRLRKSPSLLDLIQMKLSQVNSGTMSCILASENTDSGEKIDFKFAAVSGTSDKLKASNFPLVFLRIGTWEVREFDFWWQYHYFLFLFS